METMCKWKYFILQIESSGGEVAFSNTCPETGTEKYQGYFQFLFFQKSSDGF